MYRQTLLFILLTAFLISCGGGNGSPDPEITSIQPTSGPPGTMVTISGKGFAPEASGNEVSFSGTTAQISSASESQLQVIVPDGASSGSIRVTVGNKTASGPSFTVEPKAPGISSVDPQSATVGTEVTITGMNFNATVSENSISFNGTTAPINSATETELVTEVPQGATDGPIEVIANQKLATGPDFDVITEGVLEVVTSTTGFNQDNDGYRLVLDGSFKFSVNSNDTKVLAELQERNYSVSIEDIASNCTADSTNPENVTITAGDTTSVSLDFDCFQPLKNKIVFDSTRDLAGRDIYSVNPDGSDVTLITPGGLNEGYSNPEISKDGTTIALRHDRQIYTIKANGSDLNQITNMSGFSTSPSWSPDGERIVFQNIDGEDDIFVINIDGSGLQNITASPGFDAAPNWSPDGTKIAFNSDRDGDHEIFIMNPDGSGVEQMTTNSATDGSVRWSPDGTELAFASDRDGDYEIYIMNKDGSNLRQLTNNTDDDRFPAWSPDGDELAFYTDRDGNPEVYRMNKDGSGTPVNLSNYSGSDGSPHWSPLK